MTRSEIIDLAKRAAQGEAKALRQFKEAAKAAGFVGQAGGWVYFGDNRAAECQGWQNLADRVRNGIRIEHFLTAPAAAEKPAAEAPAVKLSKADRELLALMADESNPYGAVYYVPGRERGTNPDAQTRWSYQRFQPARYGMKTYVRVTAPVSRLVDAGLVENVGGPRRERVKVTAAGRAWLAAWRRENWTPVNG